MRFNNWSDEEACVEPIVETTKTGTQVTVACLRTKGHEPPCKAMANKAADLDGVCHACRQKMPGPHREDCYAPKTDADP